MIARPVHIRHARPYALLILLLLVACGAPATNTTSAPPVSATVETTAAPAQSTATFPLTIKHEAGEATISKTPERVVTVGDEITEVVAALGIKPVGVAGRMQNGVVGGQLTKTGYYTAEQIGEPTFVGTVTEPNIEAVAALKPDLILYLNYDDKIYDALAQVAPTLGYDLGKKARWQQVIVEIAPIWGREAQAEQVVREFAAQRDALRSELAPLVQQSPNVTLLYLPDAQTTFVFNEEFALGGLIQDLGFTPTPPQGVQLQNGMATISVEALANLKTDAALTLRIATDGELERYPAEELLDSLKVPVRRYVINPEQPYTGPISERAYLENFAKLLKAQE